MNEVESYSVPICLGSYVDEYGVSTNRNILLPLSYFRSHTLITGIWRIGGSQLLARIANEIYDSHPDVGIININQLSELRKNRYLYDHIYDFETKKLKIPYFIEGEDREKSIYQAAEYITASLGLGHKIKTIMVNYMLENELPMRLGTLLYEVLEHIVENKYDVGSHIIELDSSAYMLKDSRLDEIMSLTSEPIEWLNAFQSGSKIFLNMVHLPDYELTLLLNGMYQILSTFMPYNTSDLPKGLILMEEATYELLNNRHIFLEREDEDRLARYYDKLFEDYTNRGLSFILEGDQPQNFYPCILKHTKLKIFFRLWHPQNQVFHLSENDLVYVENLKNRQALVINELTQGRIRFKL